MLLHCPTCGPDGPRASYGFRAGYALTRCRQCDLVFLDHMDEVVNEAFYEDSSKSQSEKTTDQIEYWSFPDLFDKHRPIFLNLLFASVLSDA